MSARKAKSLRSQSRSREEEAGVMTKKKTRKSKNPQNEVEDDNGGVWITPCRNAKLLHVHRSGVVSLTYFGTWSDARVWPRELLDVELTD